MSKNIPIITIDGPSGSGKGTIAHLISENLGWHVLDSGAIYRVLGLYCLQKSVDLSNEKLIETLAKEFKVSFKKNKIYLDNKDVTMDVRTQEVGSAASQVGVFPSVRDALLQKQRNFAQEPGLIADGRDMGTIVFPYADLKIFLDADVGIRAKRRHSQLLAQGYDGTLDELIAQLMVRDERDKNRAVAPLLPASDSVVVNTSNLTIDETVSRVMALAKEKISID